MSRATVTRHESASARMGDPLTLEAPRGRGSRRVLPLLAALAAIVVSGCGQAATPSATGPSVGPNVPVTPLDPPTDAYQQPLLAADPSHTGHLAIAYQEGTHFSTCYLAISSDGGESWQRTALVGAGGHYPLPSDVTHCQNPKLTYGPDGSLYYVFQDSGFRNREPASIHVLGMTSTDGGASFSTPQILDPAAVSPNDWYPAAATDPSSGRLFIAWSRYVQNFRVFPGHVVVTSSADRGTSFDTAARVEAASQPDNYVGAPVIAVGADGKVYVSYVPSVPGSFSFTPGSLEVATSGDAGHSFAVSSPGSIVSGCAAGATRCTRLRPSGEVESIATGSTAGRVYAAWWDDRGPDGLARVSLSSSTDGGGSWSAPAIVGVPQGGAGNQQLRPTVRVAPDGRVDIAYYDLDTHGDQDVYWIHSGDGGATFSAPLKVDSTTSKVAVGPSAGPTQRANFGAYLGLVSTDRGAVVSWTDARRGTLDTGHQDIFAATIQLNG